MKNKKLLSSLLAASMLASAFPALAAYSTSKFDEATRTYAYSNDYSTASLGSYYDCEVERVADPDNTAEGNTVEHVTNKDASKTQSYFSGAVYIVSPYPNVWVDANKSKQFKDYGMKNGKETTFSTDLYLPTGLLDDLSNGDTVEIGLPMYWSSYEQGERIMRIQLSKTAEANTFTLTCGEKTATLNPDTWYNIKFVGTLGKNKPINFYVNDQLTFTQNLSWQAADWNENSACFGIAFKMPKKSDTEDLQLNTGFYVDNASIWQLADQDVTLNIEDNAENVSRTQEFTASFGVNVSASDYEGKIKLTPTGGEAVTAAVTQNGDNGIKFSFGKLAFDTEYTLTMDSVVNGEVLIPAQTVTFTTEHDSRLDTRNYIYRNDYSASADKSLHFIQANLIADPKDATNKVVKITDAGTATYENWSVGSVYTISPYNTIWLDAKKHKTFSGLGVTSEKEITFETDLYLPTGLLTDLKDGEVIEIGLPNYSAYLGSQRLMKITLTKTADADTFTLTYGTATKILNPDEWYNIKFVGTVGKAGPLKFCVNDEVVFKKNLSWEAEQAWLLSHFCLGISFVTTRFTGGASVPVVLDTGFYIDNGAIWQAKDVNYTLDVADGDTDVAYKKEFVANFEAAVTAEAYEGKITATDADGKAIKATVTQNGTKSLKFSFAGLAGETEYTLNFDAVTVGEASFPAKSIKFTTGVAPRIDKTKTLFSYDMSSSKPNGTSGGWENTAKLEFIDDPKDSTNKDVAYTFETDSGKRGNGRMDISPLGVWDQKGSTTIYSKWGMTDDKSLYASGRFYLTSGALAQLSENGYYKIGLGSCAADDVYTQGDMIFKKSEDGTKFVLTTKNATKEIDPDTWFELKWIYSPNAVGAEGYFNGELLDSELAGHANYQINSNEMALGVRIVTPNGTHLTQGILADDVEVYQMENAVGISKIETDLDNGKLLVDFATNPLESELSKVALKYNGTEVKNALSNPQVKANGYTVSFDIDYTALALSSEYTVAIPAGFRDVNDQKRLSFAEKPFTTPKSTTVYIDNKTVTTAPSATGAKVDVTLGNASSSKSTWVVMAVYGKYNELIALDEKTVTVEKGVPMPLSLEVTADCSKAEEVRIYVWDSPDTMNPRQKNELAWTK